MYDKNGHIRNHLIMKNELSLNIEQEKCSCKLAINSNNNTDNNVYSCAGVVVLNENFK